jgi:metal-responsive CopG/Arc/MetJ family transcriptional regulator
MGATANVVRQSISMPAKLAAQVRSLAKRRRVSASRMLVELIENGIEAQKQREREFLALAEQFRSTTDPDEVKRLGDQMGRMIFGA